MVISSALLKRLPDHPHPHVKSYVPDYEGLRAVEPSRTGRTAFSRRYIRVLGHSQSVSRRLIRSSWTILASPRSIGQRNTFLSNENDAISRIIVS